MTLLHGAQATIDIADWKRHCAFGEGLSADSAEVVAFWGAVERHLTPGERAAMLAFSTGLPSPPAGGFRNLVGYIGDPSPFTLARLPAGRGGTAGGGGADALPMASACFNTLRLPALPPGLSAQEAEAEMARKLRIVVSSGACGFGDT